jgi:hypothetical protein
MIKRVSARKAPRLNRKSEEPKPAPGIAGTQQVLAKGQIWKMASGYVQITDVGKVLLYYRMGRIPVLHGRTRVGTIEGTEAYFRQNNAVLLS